MDNLILMALEFFKTGLFAVGGGLATIPFLTEMAHKHGWFTVEALSTMIAVSESTPGPIGINMATYVGSTVAGVAGSVVATVSLVAPSLIVICIIANMLEKFKESSLVKMIFSGLKPAVVAFIVSACIGLFTTTLLSEGGSANMLMWIDWKAIALLAVLMVVHNKYPKLHPGFYIVFAAVMGILLKF